VEICVGVFHTHNAVFLYLEKDKIQGKCIVKWQGLDF
jgi:hypothetical protein